MSIVTPNVFRILIIDDNKDIHSDFMKVLASDEPNEKEDSFAEIDKLVFKQSIDNAATNRLPTYKIDTATQGEEGLLKVYEALQTGSPYALAFVDVRMPPGIDGIETVAKIIEIDKNIQIVICTAYSDYSFEDMTNILGVNDNILILKKPFDYTVVRQIASALTKKWQLVHEKAEYANLLELKVRNRTASLSDAVAKIRATLESSADGILVVDNNQKIIDFNNKLLSIVPGIDLNQSNVIFDKVLQGIIDESQDASAFSNDIQHIKSDTSAIILGNLFINNDSIIEYYSQPYLIDSEIQGRVWSFRDITKRAQLEKQLAHQATHDELTSLPNRAKLSKAVHDLTHVAPQSHPKEFALLFLDINRFKLINDSLGHHAGDEVLKTIAVNLNAVLTRNEILYRLGGDEFVILATDYNHEANIIDLCNRVFSAFNQHLVIKDTELVLSTSIGVSMFPKDGHNYSDLLRNADIAMYQAKETSVNSFAFFSKNLLTVNTERLRIESDLRHALENKEFVLYYQPQYDMNSNKLISAEALIRWHHPVRGLLSPMEFIPYAEDSGLIIPIGEWVIREACEQIIRWLKMDFTPIRIGVNVSPVQFRGSDLVKTVAAILQETKAPPEFIELELTENLIINNLDVIDTIHRLKKLGVNISLDDFGTGNSSLNYLRELPVDRIKIDQSYIRNITTKKGDEAIIKAIISMAKTLNMTVIAEGVETDNQLAFLKSNACKEIQGFIYSKPIDSAALEKLFDKDAEKLSHAACPRDPE